MLNALRRKIVGLPAASLVALTIASAPALATDLSGAGATFPYPIYARWAEAYKAKTGIGLNYQSIGSGGGIKQIEAGTVDFGASDMPLEPKDLEANGLMQFPTVMGGVVPVINVPGVGAGKMRLTGPVLADVYLGKITKWNDAALKQLNPGVQLPDSAISVVHRSDGSGTTFIFTHYLSEVDPEWKQKVGENTSVSWPVGVGGKGNEGVADYTARLPGAIGYVEYAYALQNKLTYTLMRNKSGAFVAPTANAFAAAAANADWASAPGFHLLLTNQPGPDSWPITGATFILMHRTQEKLAVAQAVLAFFDWAYGQGDDMAAQLDYVPMPDSVVKLIEQTWATQLRAADGKPVWQSH